MSAPRLVELVPLEPGEYEATEADLAAHAEYLNVDLEYERDLLPIVRAGLTAALPEHWVPCKVDGTEDYFYFNKKTSESIWDHPLDDHYRQLVVEARERRQCYVVNLELLQGDGESEIRGRNLAGDILVAQTTSPTESFGDVEDRLRGLLRKEDERVLCFALPSGELIGFSCRSKTVMDVFKQD